VRMRQKDFLDRKQSIGQHGTDSFPAIKKNSVWRIVDPGGIHRLRKCYYFQFCSPVSSYYSS